MATFSFTLLVYLSLALAVAASANPNTFGLHRRDHGDLARLVKKRTPVDLLGPSPQGQETPSALQPSQGSSAAAQTSSANSVSSQGASPSSPSASAVSRVFNTGTFRLLKQCCRRALLRPVVTRSLLCWVASGLLGQVPLRLLSRLPRLPHRALHPSIKHQPLLATHLPRLHPSRPYM